MNKNYLLLFILVLLISCSSSDKEIIDDSPSSTVTVSDFTVTIDENPNNFGEIGQIEASTSSGTLIYSITNQSPLSAMDIDINTGIISVRDSSLFNFEVNPTLIAVANVTNGEVTERANIEINLNDIYEKYSHIGNITLESQEEVNEFGEENPWGISGRLTILGGDIIDLSPISGIKDIGSLVIKDFDHPMPDISFIQEIIYSITIENNPGIETLEWIPTVVHLESDLVIKNNDQITNLQGIPNQLTTVRYLYITNNNSLVNLDGLQNITNITKKIFIESNNSLENLNGIQNLASSVTEGINIINNNVLYDITAFSSTTTIAGSIYFVANNNLVNLSGLDNLSEINGNFTIDSHPFIINLDDLSNLQSVNGDFKINHNPQLNNLCGIANLITNGTITGDYIVETNLYNPTQQDIIDGNCSN